MRELDFSTGPVDSCRRVPRNMPVDFASYLLSSSPPGFDFYLKRSNFGGKTVNIGNEPGSGSVKDSDESNSATLCKSTESEVTLGHGDLLFSVDDCAGSTNVSQNIYSDSNSRNRGCGSKKRVSFADEKGFSLTCVKILRERPDSPPHLRPDIISSLTYGASAEAIETPPLVLNFSQPASEYLAFRQKIDRDLVSLENAILKDYTVFGTIRVKNTSFEKEVFVRCTFDDWSTFTDISASYLQNEPAYDTFSFQINVPPNMDIRKTVQFAVCYTANKQQYWDNNSGKNYEIISADFRTIAKKDGRSDCVLLSPQPEVSRFGEFSVWQNAESSVPYW